MTLSSHEKGPLDAVQAAELSGLRERIDAVDRRLLGLLVRRGAFVQRLAALKRSAGLPLHDPAREMDLVAGLRACDHAPYSDEEVQAIWGEVLAASRALMARDAEDRGTARSEG